jgi:hypothetical protein
MLIFLYQPITAEYRLTLKAFNINNFATLVKLYYYVMRFVLYILLRKSETAVKNQKKEIVGQQKHSR